jgi:arginase family enzyme
MDLQKLTFDGMASFFDNNGCWDYALKVADYVHNVLPDRPIMIGIDHSLTGGSLLALSKKYCNLNVVVLDAHFDVVKSKDRGNRFGFNGKNRPIFYHCGNFLSLLLENQIIQPKNLWILGVDEEILGKRSYKIDGKSQTDDEIDVDKWLSEGVHLITKKMVSSKEFALDLNGPTYVSIDMDVGSLMSVYSARFMNCYGLNTVEFLNLVSNVKRSLNKADVSLVGLDMMEIDIHFLEAEQDLPYKDHTRYLAKKSIEILLEGELG